MTIQAALSALQARLDPGVAVHSEREKARPELTTVVVTGQEAGRTYIVRDAFSIDEFPSIIAGSDHEDTHRCARYNLADATRPRSSDSPQIGGSSVRWNRRAGAARAFVIDSSTASDRQESGSAAQHDRLVPSLQD
ncbi:hypothetical protein MMC07_000409 [Pseudocyphellaria aurata]|nr:hypothetical protein [Pseudocyphellaria aurata]